MTRSRRRLIISVVLLLISAGVVALIVRPTIKKHGGIVGTITSVLSDTKQTIEKWCGDQLLAIAQAHLNPDLKFDTIVYEYPATVVLSNIKLTSEGTEFVHATSMRVEFTETPKSGKPIVIQSVELRDPVVRLIRQENGKLIGFSNLLRRGTTGQNKPEVNPAGVPSRRVSDVFAIRRIGVINGSVEYSIANEPPMILDQLTFDLTSKPTEQVSGTDTGWYAMAVVFARAPLFNWKMNGQLNVDSGVLAINESNVQMKLAADQYQLLPPQIQGFIREHEIVGDLAASIHGEIPLRTGPTLHLDFHTTLNEGRIAFGDYVLPVQSLGIIGNVNGDVLKIQPLDYAGLGGSVHMIGDIQLSSAYPTKMNLDVRDVRIEQALRDRSADPPRFAGQMNLRGDATVELSQFGKTADGKGRVEISNGRLVNFPVIGSLIRAASTVTGGDSNSDHGSADLRMANEHVRLTAIDLISGPIAARGEGEIGFDSRLNFRLNAGPLERLQEELGSIGDLIGRVTDKLVSYYIMGTLDEPVVSVKALGLGGGGGE